MEARDSSMNPSDDRDNGAEGEERPYAHRMDLPEHERKISGESLAMLRKGIESARIHGVRVISAAELGLHEDE